MFILDIYIDIGGEVTNSEPACTVQTPSLSSYVELYSMI